MRYRIKQWFAVLLALMMTLTTLPVTALAESVAPTEETKVEQVQSLIDELPEAEEITAETRADVQAQLGAIGAAMLDLTEDDVAALDTARYDAAAAALQALDAPTGDNGMEANIDPDPEPSTPEQVQALIDELPDAEEITAETRDDVQAQIDAIDAAMLELTEDQAAALDTARYDAAAAALLALDAPSILEQVQALIDALPEADSIMDDNRENVELQLSAIDEKKLSLTDGERAMLDVTRYNAAVSAILALDRQAADVPMPIDKINGFEWTFDGTATVTLDGSGELYIRNARFPDGVTKIIVNGASSIGEGCFEGWSGLESVELGPSVTAIGNRAFYECTNLSHLRGCGGLETIGDSAFYDCEMLQFVELPASVTTIGKSAFCMCHSLRLTSLPAGLTTIEEEAFYGCESMALTELPAGLTSIGEEAFNGCRSLMLTEIPEGVISIGNFALDDCQGLTHLTLPASLASMGHYVFQNSKNLTTLTFLGTTAPTIDSSTFVNANGLREILIPAGATGYDAEHGWPMDKVKVGHTVTVNSALGGSASAAPTYAGVGDTIVLTATPDEGYHFVRWETEPTVEVTDDRFTMPGEDVTVTPVFEPHDFSGALKTSPEKHWHECSCGEKRGEGTHTYTNGVCSACGYSFECDIFVKTLSGGHTELHVNSTDTVRSVKEKIKENEGIPVSLQVLKLPTSSAELENDKCLADCGVTKDSTLHLTLRYAPGGDGTADDPYLIPDRERLEAFRYYINSMSKDGGAGQYFKLTADIDLKNEPWSPIGTGYGYPFGGTFDGGGHIIRGLNIKGEIGSKNENLGFFRKIGQGGMVKDLTVAGSVTGGAYTGGIVGENEGTVENCRNTCTVSAPDRHAGGVAGCNLWHGTVKNCSNTGAVTGDCVGGIVGQNETTVEGCSNAGLVTGDCVGGIVGTDLEGTIKDCSNAGPVEGNSASGIVNDLYDTTVENCSNTGTVTGNSASGITGLTIGTIKNCYNTGAVSGSEAAAGIVRDSYESTVENCYNTGAVTGETASGVAISNEDAAIKNCYNTGAVTGETTGGVVADNLGGVVENCYYLDACGGTGEGTPKAAAQFASGEVAWLLQKGQDPQVWGQTVGSGAPELTDSAEKTVYRITGKVEGQDSLVWYSNRAATLPAPPVRPGFAFEGWSTAEGGSVDFAVGAAVSEDRTVYAIFTDKRLEGVGSVTMADYTCGDSSVEPVAVSSTNGTANVTFTYSVKGQDEFSETKPTTAGEYTVKAVFAATDSYHEVTATADFRITHQFNAGWEHRADGDYHLCACGTQLLLETKELNEVPEGLLQYPNVDTVEEIERALVEKVATGNHYVVYDVELEALIDGKWQIVTPENLPEEGVEVTIPYPEGTNAQYSFTVVHMFTTAGDGHQPGDTEVLETTNGPDGIHFTVKSFSPIAIGWKTGNLTVTVTDTGEGAGPAQQWQFRVELDDKTVTGTFGEMEFTAGVAEFTLASGQSLTARDLPVGVKYTVTELEADQNGYTTTYTDDSGFITSEQDMVAAFVNDKPAQAKPDKPSDDPDTPTDNPPDTPTDNPPDTPTDTPPDTPTSNNPNDTPKTGDESHLALWLSLMILSLIGITVIILTPIIGRKKLVSTNGRHMRK